MDDGAKTAELIFRIGISAQEMMLRMALGALKALIKHMEWLKQHNIKPIWKARIDKMETKFVQVTASLIEKQVEVFRQKETQKEREIDRFKLDKQYELEKYNSEINKAKTALELSKGTKDNNKIVEKQLLFDQALENKRKFEYQTNQELMVKNHELDNYKNELKQCEYDLKVCNAKLNALYSYQNIETGRVKREYQDIKEKYTSQEIAINKGIESLEVEKQTFSSLDEMEIKLTEKPVYEGKKHKTEVKKDTEKSFEDDIVAKMLAKDPEALKNYQEKKTRGDFNINIPDLSKNKGMDIGM